MLFSKQVIYCNACGIKLEIEYPKVIGRVYKCCSVECSQEMYWRETLSNMGKEYYARKKDDNG